MGIWKENAAAMRKEMYAGGCIGGKSEKGEEIDLHLILYVDRRGVGLWWKSERSFGIG
jgi:hypothetical protein